MQYRGSTNKEVANPTKRSRKGFREAVILSKSLKKTMCANILKSIVLSVRFRDKYIYQMK